MQYYLKVSPKGQVVLPKKLREALEIKDMLEIDLQDDEGILRKPEGTAGTVAGCFKQQAADAQVSIEQALDKAREMVAHEIAAKNH